MNRLAELVGDHEYESVLDCYHATEHAVLVAKTLFGEGATSAHERYERWTKNYLQRERCALIEKCETLLKNNARKGNKKF